MIYYYFGYQLNQPPVVVFFVFSAYSSKLASTPKQKTHQIWWVLLLLVTWLGLTSLRSLDPALPSCKCEIESYFVICLLEFLFFSIKAGVNFTSFVGPSAPELQMQNPDNLRLRVFLFLHNTRASSLLLRNKKPPLARRVLRLLVTWLGQVSCPE